MAENRAEGAKGQFSAAVPQPEPTISDKHQPGKIIPGSNDAVPEFSAEVLPAGSAPTEHTYEPQTEGEAPPLQNYYKDGVGEGQTAKASDTIMGATSGDVHQGLGKPVEGQSSKELRDGTHTSGGVEAVGGRANQSTVNPHDPHHMSQRALDKDDAVVGRGDKASAEDREPQSAESVASERR
ncbi:hypothetical protein CERZMDRAFT_96798 [Cercospora zeae-maydis SCOH1-5]|uniref:Uncharacterized protein n=1 Tax=Cercospora zeae-maydis SCOH1-5 TaxID=717836 RepID=A0A6A6FI82_9PEZI|nr:hypothetical protein CERZMDRAFT_96798 [Cercospora zeae-maydis SCOH1-5]